MARIDRVGSTVRYRQNEESPEYSGKIIYRKKDGSVVISCIDGPNRGNTKRIFPEDIIVPKTESIQRMIESPLPTRQILQRIVEEKPFRISYFISEYELGQVIKALERSDGDFYTKDTGDEILGWFRGENQLTFRYVKETGTIYADYRLPVR